ncbi:fas-binding factor 1 [Pogoniulus pusillus]|uniref:fas-binding factor 1 n=1 Tax=Pogoniulus pusillus TaxID=488313 RepID=UPI0030B95681
MLCADADPLPVPQVSLGTHSFPRPSRTIVALLPALPGSRAVPQLKAERSGAERSQRAAAAARGPGFRAGRGLHFPWPRERKGRGWLPSRDLPFCGAGGGSSRSRALPGRAPGGQRGRRYRARGDAGRGRGLPRDGTPLAPARSAAGRGVKAAAGARATGCGGADAELGSPGVTLQSDFLVRRWNGLPRAVVESPSLEAAKPSKKTRGSTDDILEELLGYDVHVLFLDDTPVKSARASQPSGINSGRAWGANVQASKKSFLEDDFFSKLPAKDIKDEEASSASNVDSEALLQTLKDMDDMDADLLGLSKPSSGAGKTAGKGPGKCDPSGGGVKSTGKPPPAEKGEPVPLEKKPLSSPSASQQHKKSNFEDLDDPLPGLSSNEEQDAPKKLAPAGTKSSSDKKPDQSKEKEPPQTPQHTAAPARRRAELTFEDDGDDLMDALGFGSGPKDEKQGKKAEEEELRPARSKLEELLGRGSVAKVLEQPSVGEHREFKLDKKYQKQPEKEEDLDKEDFVFGAYQPTVASVPKATARRQSVRFSAENSSEPKPEPHAKAPPPPASQSPVRSRRSGSDWLGLKDEDFLDSEPPSPGKASPVVCHPSPAAAGQPSSASQLWAAEEAAAKPEAPEEENWLAAALARKKAQVQAKAQERNAKPVEVPGGGLDPLSSVSQPATSTAAPQQAAAQQEDKTASTDGSGQLLPWLSTSKQAPAHPLEAVRGEPSRDISISAWFPGEQETQDPAPVTQVATPRTHLQAAPRLQAESPALGSLHERRLGAATAQGSEDASGCQAALLGSQARVVELESQVRMLELERTQHKLLLESLQKRHQEDLELLENAHRSQVKVVEETYGQREERLRREKEQLMAQLLSQSQEAEQARAELLAQHQQRLAALEQQSTLELERVRELQRVSVQEMRKDHEEQLQRLQRLKEQEISAVTSATAHARSLNGVVEQIEKFSSDLHDLFHKIEAMHHSTSQELATEARQRDKQLKVLQDRLLQQQRDMEEERSRLQEVIAKMEARLSEQARLLEQERWKAAAEQSKVESLQRSLEEQRRATSHQLSMERAELERAKSSLLEEQKSVMQKCSEERRKLAAEWAEFHTQQQLSKERMERDMDRALQMDSHREGTIISLAKEQAVLKIRDHELKAREEQLAKDRELLDKAWQELRLEKEKANVAALRIRQREEEIKSVTKLSSQKYEEGERALREARRIESKDQSRLQAVQQQWEQLKQQEQQLQQERLSMAQQRRQLEQLREELSLTMNQDISTPMKGLSSTLSPLNAAASHGQVYVPDFPRVVRHSPGCIGETLATASPDELQVKLLLLKHRAQQDRAFLEDEQFFLETLKEASYNTSSLSG